MEMRQVVVVAPRRLAAVGECQQAAAVR